jgi:hypothetical protein
MPITEKDFLSAIDSADFITSIYEQLGPVAGYLVRFSAVCARHRVKLPSEFQRHALLQSSSRVCPRIVPQKNAKPTRNKYFPTKVAETATFYNELVAEFRRRILASGPAIRKLATIDRSAERAQETQWAIGFGALLQTLSFSGSTSGVWPPTKDSVRGYRSAVNIPRDFRGTYPGFERAEFWHQNPLIRINVVVNSIEAWLETVADVDPNLRLHPISVHSARNAAKLLRSKETGSQLSRGAI